MDGEKIESLFSALEKRKDKYTFQDWKEKLLLVKEEVVMDYLKDNAIDDLNDLYWGIWRVCDFETKGNLQGYANVETFRKELNELRKKAKEKIDKLDQRRNHE